MSPAVGQDIVGILLAAGNSSRFGSNKLLQPLEDGTAMVVAAATQLSSVLSQCIAVVSDANNDVAQQLAKQGFRQVVNAKADQGMGSSIACGVAASRDAKAWVIALADMPFIAQSVIQDIVSGLEQGAEIIAPIYQQRRGHPVGFSNEFGPTLQQLHTDRGARDIITANIDHLVLFETNDQGVIVDIDTIKDLTSLGQ